MMKTFLFLVFVLSALTLFGQDDRKIKEAVTDDLKNLFKELNEAVRKHDKKALEQIYADEFIFVHAFGYIDNKAEQIAYYMDSDSVSEIRTPSFDQLYVYDNIAIVRMTVHNPRGNNLMSTSIYRNTNGRWQIIQVQSTLQQPQRKLIDVAAQTLQSYVGRYIATDGSVISMTTDDRSLIVQRTGRPKQKLSATSEEIFFDKIGSRYSFFTDTKSNVSHFVWLAPDGQEKIFRYTR